MEREKLFIEAQVEWLDKMLLRHDGSFKYSIAVKSIKAKFEGGEISYTTYLELFEVCVYRKKDGHYRNSMAYQRYVKQEV